MSYLSNLREDNPHLNDYNDEEVLSILPKLDPGKFEGLNIDQIKFVATNDEWQITKGFKSGVDQVQALGGGAIALAGDAIGSEGLKEEGLSIYDRNMKEASLRQGNVTGFTDIDGVEDTFDWAGYTLGNMVPSLATVIGTGGIGGAIAKVGGKKLVDKLVQSQVERGVSQEAAKKAASAELAKRISKGQAAGAYAASTGLMSGSIYGDTGDVGVSITHGLIGGAFDAIPALRLLKQTGLGQEAKQAVVKSVKAEMAKQGILEGSTELLQSMTEQHAKYWVENNSESLLANIGEVNTKELIDNFAAGALGGAAAAGPIAYMGRERPGQASQETQDSTQPEEETNAADQFNETQYDNQTAQQTAVTQQQYFQAINTPITARTAEENQIINEFQSQDIAPAETPISSHMESAQVEIARAGDEAAAAGGDALDQATAKGQAQEGLIPSAVREEKKVAENRTSNRNMTGIDGMIISARRLGFYEEEVRLNNAKAQFEKSIEARNQGDIARADRLQRSADAIVQDVVAMTEPLAREAYGQTPSTNFPTSYAYQGDITGGEITPTANRQQDSAVFDGSPLPKIENGQRALLENVKPGQPLSNGVILGNEPDYSTQARQDKELAKEQQEADHFNAFYGPSNAPTEAAIEGQYFANGEMEASARFREGVPSQSAIENNSFKQLETDNAIYVEPESESESIRPQSLVPEGIGENIINRMADLPTAIEHRPVISTEEFKQLQHSYQQVVRKAVSKRTEEEKAAVQVYQQARSGKILVEGSAPVAEPSGIDQQTEPKMLPQQETEENQQNTEAESGKTKAEQQATTGQKNKQSSPLGKKIDDFGERLEGANKHNYTLNEALSEDVDISAIPLSKSFPKPDYEKLILSGVAPEKVAYIAMQRARIPTKPRKSYKLPRWQEQVEKARDIARSLLSSGTGLADIVETKQQNLDASLASLASEILPEQIESLAGFSLSDRYFSLYGGVEGNVSKIIVGNTKNARERSGFDTVEQALSYIKNQTTTVTGKGKPAAKFDVWTERGNTGYFVGKKVASGKYVELHKTDSAKEARAYIAENNETLVELLKEKKKVKATRRPTNNPRIGEDYRKGKDVTPELFTETFGFRGVQFGNWVEGGRRQEDLNNAYDGLIDLANVIDVSPQALSLNGELGLAFGARGKGGANAAMAHYEPSNVVINLTKNSGSGSLAHEWFHALDNYFGKMDSNTGSTFVTSSDRPRRIRKMVDGQDSFARSAPEDFKVRLETYEAFQNIKNVIKNDTQIRQRSKNLDKLKTKDYWSTVIEMTARSFEQYVISKLKSKGYASDYLANVGLQPRNEEIAADYPYPLKSEMDAIADAYDNLFSVLEEKKTPKGTALYSIDGSDVVQMASSNQNSSSALGLDTVESVAGKLARRLKLRGVKITVVDTQESLPEAIKQQYADEGITGGVNAVYHENTIYIVADQMSSVAEIEDAVLHETAHFGGEVLLGSELNKVYQKLALKLGGVNGIKKKAEEYGFNMGHYFKLADEQVESGEMGIGQRSEFLVDEFLAHASGHQAYSSLPKRIQTAIQEFIGRVRDILRKLGAAELAEISDSDIAYLLKRLRHAAKGEVKYADRPHYLSTTDADINDIIQNHIDEEATSSSEKAKFSHSAASEQAAEADGSGLGASIGEMKSTFIRRIADKFQPLKEVQKGITDSGREISEEANAYQYEELFHGKAEEDLREMTDNFVEPLAKQMAEFDITQSDLDAYLYARHAPERNAHIASINPEMPEGGSGMSDKQAADIMRDVRSSGKLNKYNQLASTIYDMTQAQRNVVRDNGLEDTSVIDAWESKYEFYVPLKGYAANETETGRPSTGKGFSIGGKESKRALGRKSKANSPSAQVIQDLTEKLIRKRKNEVALSFLKLAEGHPDANMWSIYTNSNPEKSRTSKQVKDPETGEMKTVVKEQAVPMAMFSDRYFTAKRDGKTYYIKIKDPLLMNAMKNIGPENNSFIVKTLGKVIRFMSALNTSYNPEFALSNFPRDLQTAILNLEAEQSRDDGKVKGKKIAAQTVKDVPAAMKAVYRGLRGKPDMSNEWDVWFDEFLKSGAKTGYFDMKDLNEQQETVKTLIDIAKGGPKGKALQWARATTKFVDDANSAVENAVRLAAYVNARKAGISQQKSASLVKNMTVNFNRRGELGTLINSLYMFANASIQGTMNFTRTMTGLNGDKGDPVWSRLNTAQKISFGMMAGAYALAMLNRSVAGEDDDGENFYDKIPAHDKERNIIIMKSFHGGKEGEYHKIPLAYGYNIFHVFGTSVEAMLGGEKPIGEELAKIGLAAAGSFSPVGFQHSEDMSTMALKNITPTLLKPFVDLTANENFMGSAIRNENSPYGVPKPDSSLARRSTPEGYKKVAELLNEMSGGSYYQSGFVDINPDSMRYLVGYFTGAAGNFAVNKVPDNITRLANGVELEPHRTVFLGRANGKVLPYADVNKFYKRRDEIVQIEAEMKSLTGSYRHKFVAENTGKLQLRARFKGTEKVLKGLRKRRNAIYAADLTLKERDSKLKAIEKQMKVLIDRMNKVYVQAS